MKIFNLTDKTIVYRGRQLLPYAVVEMDVDHIPDRDMLLQDKGMLAFGELPKGWTRPKPVVSGLAAPKDLPAIIPEFNPIDRSRAAIEDKVEKATKPKDDSKKK